MRNPARLLALAAICAAALWAASAPASALTVSVGGEQPTVPLPLPLPIGATAGVGGSTPLQVDVQAPAATDISVKAGPSGLDANATAANTPLLDLRAGSGDGAPLPAPIGGSAPVAASPTPDAPATVATPSPSASPSSSRREARTGPNAGAVTAPGGAAALAERQVGSVRAGAAGHDPSVTASIASSPRAGYLGAFPTIGARVLLWLALAGAVIALRLFVGSATKATRAG